MPRVQELELKKIAEEYSAKASDLKRTVFIDDFITLTKEIVKAFQALKAKNEQELQDVKESLNKSGAESKSEIQKVVNQLEKDTRKRFDKLSQDIESMMNMVRDKLREVRDGEDADEEAMIERLKAMIPVIPEYETPQELVDDIAYVKEEHEKILNEIEELKKVPRGTVGGGVTNVRIQQAFKYILKTEQPSGDIDGANTAYTVTQPIFAVLAFSLNGETIAQLPNYTIAGKTITFSSALPAAYSGKDFEVKYI